MRQGRSAHQIEVRLSYQLVYVTRDRYDYPERIYIAGGYRFKAAGLQGEAKVHRLDGIAERVRARQVDHVALPQHVDSSPVARQQRLQPRS